ncbi:Glycosyltransferase involved in cell wall bisynthesis [Salegentibacter echinorum]|uniref:Glycosyltransferase involved in cell wall bisynthesis n=1 Tax=Salegentibacter echinorum TaxID=1073325 RepID=A0A1M5F476_SALEC|nr:glycosyltransferase family 2 protein [Salegentibacter echinorum]SHF86275.1 Glycosyltransferase involved in cell wall bisynthesis [Salegentibacter echinorum]
MAIDTSVVLSTYNATEWLEKVLWSYTIQSYRNFEIVIADDGSKEPTKKLIEDFKKLTEIPIQHIWHPDRGFQKSEILNKAVMACKSDYIIMSDGDCIAREDFVEMHVKYREFGYFLSGGYYKLPMKLSKEISKEDILTGKCFNLKWLKERGLKSSFKNNKISAKGAKTNLLNFLTPTSATWNGHNASGWKNDIEKVNGFDERMQYGGQDRELGERLMNLGIKGKQIRYTAICLHLDHKRGYKNEESINKNKAIRKKTKEEKLTSTKFGIKKNSPA